MQKTLAFVAVLLVTVALGSFFARGCARRSETLPPAKTTSVGLPSAVTEVEKKAGIRKKRLPRENGELLFEVSLGAVKGCTYGDMNAIELDVEHSAEKRLLLTLEPVDGKGSALVREITPRELRFGLVHQFRLKPVSGMTPLGLFLCKDSKKQGRCAGKQTVDVNAILGTYADPTKTAGGYDAPDHVYFFQMVAIDADDDASTLEEGRLNKTRSEALSEVISDKTAFQRIVASTNTLYSLQLDIQTRYFAIQLPYFDEPSCAANKNK